MIFPAVFLKSCVSFIFKHSQTKCFHCQTLKYSKIAPLFNSYLSMSTVQNGVVLKQLDESTINHNVELDNHFIDFLEIHELNESSEFMKHFLYPSSEDEIVNQMKNCNSIDAVFDIVENFTKDVTTTQHICQAILMLRKFQRLFTIVSHMTTKVPSNISFEKNIIDNKSFFKLLKLLDYSCYHMNADELSACLLYLNKLSLSVADPLMMKLITLYEKQINKMDVNEISLCSLAQFCLAIKSYPTIWSIYTLRNLVPILIHCLENCDGCNYEDFRYITTCLQTMPLLVNESFLNLYKGKCEFLLENVQNNNQLELSRMRTILKTVLFLDHKAFNCSNLNEIRKLLSTLSGSIHMLSIDELIILNRKIIPLQEPAYLLNEVANVCSNWITEFNTVGADKSLMHLLLLFVTVPHQYLKITHDEAEKLLYNYLTHPFHEFSIRHLYTIYFFIRNNMIFNIQIYMLYWSNVADIIAKKPEEIDYEIITTVCQRYFNFKRIDKFTHLKFEKTALSNLLTQINDAKIACRPYMFTKLASFILLFSDDDVSFSFINNMVDKLERNILHLNCKDTVKVSFVISSLMKHKHGKKANFYVKLMSALNSNMKNHLEQKQDLSIVNLNDIFLGYICRKGPTTSKLFMDIVNKYKMICHKDLNSKSIKDAISNFNDIHYVLPAFVDTCVNYCILNKQWIHSDVIMMLLNYCYNYGYCPTQLEALLPVAIEHFNRDKEYLSSLSAIKFAVNLCYFNALPWSIAHLIFSLDGVKKIDHAAHMLTNHKLLLSLKSCLMELNRSICLDYPEYNVPWFHSSYYEPTKKNTKTYSKFHIDVLEILTNLVQDTNLISLDHYSPYNQKIDFLLCLRKDGTLVNTNLYKDPTLEKIAILVEMHTSSFPYYYQKGKTELQHRHLEMLGYKVIPITIRNWNAMFMSESREKLSYLRSKIWSS